MVAPDDVWKELIVVGDDGEYLNQLKGKDE
jgi:hypothetical protein